MTSTNAARALVRIRQNAFEAAAAQDFLTASKWLLRAVEGHHFQSHDCANLAYVAFNYCSRSTRIAIYERLRTAGIGDPAASVPATFLHLSFELDLGDADPKELVRRRYIERILAPQVKLRPPKPIVFWHIPKCSGTSLNVALSSHFYHSAVSELLPSYNYRPMVGYLIAEMLDEIPYFPSMHFGMDDLTPGTDCFSFSVLRDPVKRCLSMYRQEAATNARLARNATEWHHYRAFARYGAFWDYRNDRSFACWMQNIPEWLLLRQLTTFSARRDLQQATERLSRLDYVLARGLDAGSEAGLFAALGLDYAPEAVPTHLNRSDKRIHVPDQLAEVLHRRLSQEYDFLRSFFHQSDREARADGQRPTA